jgi:hypothetical protein
MREFYCISCRSLHKVDVRNNDTVRILSTGYHIVGAQRYQICICDFKRAQSSISAVSIQAAERLPVTDR